MYVVTLDTRPVTGPGQLAGLRRMPLPEAREVAALAVRAMRRPTIVDADTLTAVTLPATPCAPDCDDRTACPDAGTPGHSMCGTRPDGTPRHH